MRNSLTEVLLLLALLLPAVTAADEACVNGYWYDGNGFVERTVYVSDGGISFTPPEQVDVTHDLAGGYVIPPFGEAHNHDLTTDFEPQERISEYLRDGVFYTKMQSAFSNGFEKLAPHFNKPDSVDASQHLPGAEYRSAGGRVRGQFPGPRRKPDRRIRTCQKYRDAG